MHLQKTALLILIAACMSLSACVTTPMGITSSATPLQGKVIAENLGHSEGRDSTVAILGLWTIGSPDIDSAIQSAVTAKAGDTLINVRYYKRTSYFILFSITRFTVEGDVIKFKTDDQTKKKK